ncbi:Core-2/I-Branching enzyme [Catalinimonas alkaloidigena]|uniref:Core-2/I-Branching enzyme n=1 Tax=Catalinimonas alkaloidigena TaxID=1075417 RepID=A0A1G9LEP8_9BACT|nr:beta-1,6-N-acetylglucosaminyltransferase [Catalinimonas alkaloidigena]SDL59985.1 Core-2/I-Branching enzyme [Catalinimonas alkaloidigena]
MPTLGFYILSYQPPDPVFLKLLARLREIPGAVIAVHHDYEQSDFPTEVIEQYQLQMVPQSRRTYWSHLNNVLATFDVLKVLYEHPNHVDWFVALTPGCYPIKKAEEIVQFFAEAKEDYYLDIREVTYKQPKIELDKWIADGLYKEEMLKIPFLSKKGHFYWRSIYKERAQEQLPFNDKFKLYHGSNWMMMNRKVVEKLWEDSPYHHALVNFYQKHIHGEDQHPCPQEVIIPSLIGNLKEVNGIVTENYRYIDWKEASDWHPNTLTIRHWEALKTSDALWARKFNFPESTELLEKIDDELLS